MLILFVEYKLKTSIFKQNRREFSVPWFTMLLIFCFIYVGKWYAYHLDVDRAESNTRPCCLTFREVFQSTNTWEGKFGAVSRWSEWILVFRAYSIKHLLCIFWNIIVVYGVNSFDQLKLLVSFWKYFQE